MAIYQGARVQQGVLPRRRPSRAVRAQQGSDGVGLTLAVILAGFLLGLVYLNQSIRATATSYDLDSLLVERQRLTREIQSLGGEAVRYGAEPVIVQAAQQHGLDRLGGTVRVPAP